MQTTPIGASGRHSLPSGACADPRRLNPAIATATFELGDLAPRLAGLLHIRLLPDATVRTILDWSDEVASQDAGEAFALDRLRTVLPALVTAWLGAHTYSKADPDGDGPRCVDLHDQGCGALVGAVMDRLDVIATALHGDDGRRLVAATQAGLADHLDRIAAMVQAQ